MKARISLTFESSADAQEWFREVREAGHLPAAAGLRGAELDDAGDILESDQLYVGAAGDRPRYWVVEPAGGRLRSGGGGGD